MCGRMTETESLRARVESFPRWHYEFDLNGTRTPIFDRAHVNRHAQRKECFFSPLVQLCGGSLAGKRAEFVFGIDGRQMHVDQANLVFEAKGIDASRYRFEVGDIFSADLQQDPFDVVLCLGLLYHVSKPFELFERMSSWGNDFLVLDTTLITIQGQYFRLAGQDLDEPRSAVDRPVALHPTSEAVARLAHEFGYHSAMLRPRFTNLGRKRLLPAGKPASVYLRETHPAGRPRRGTIGGNVPAPWSSEHEQAET